MSRDSICEVRREGKNKEKVRGHCRVEQAGRAEQVGVTEVVHSRAAKVQQDVDDMPGVTRDMLPLWRRSE